MENNIDNVLEEIEKIKNGLKESEKDLKEIKIEATDSRELIKTEFNGKGELLNISFLSSDISAEELKPILIESVNNGLEKVKELKTERKQKVLGNIELPDIPGLFE